MTVPPTQQQQYLQSENQERTIERQLNVGHQSKEPCSEPSAPYNPGAPTLPTTCPNALKSTPDTSLNNITSASLANLAKGMEQNISEMSQNMTQGGPYGDVQPGATVDNTTEQPCSVGMPTSMPSTTNQQQPSVNNTFVNAHMSIGQVNIQNVTANQSYRGPGMPGQMQQHLDVSMNNFAGSMPPGPQAPQTDPMYKPTQPPAPAVSIQNKGRNTIQYHPVSQPSIAPSRDSAVPPKQTFDFMPAERFPSPTPNFLPGENPHLPLAVPQRHPGPMYSGAVPAPQG